MAHASVYHVCILLCLQSFIVRGGLAFPHVVDLKVLNVGEELERESLPLQMGQRLYKLHGLKVSRWYEVKISYPASIPASFSIQLKRDVSTLWLGKNRRLLNTEKLIFKNDVDNLESDLNETYALVTVEAAGIVANPHVPERDVVLFNIVCDELSFGIPHKARCIALVAVLCLALAVVIPYFLPPHLLLENEIRVKQPSCSEGFMKRKC